MFPLDSRSSRVTSEGCDRQQRPLREGLPPAWSKKEVSNESAQEEPEPCIQRDIHIQVGTRGWTNFRGLLELINLFNQTST